MTVIAAFKVDNCPIVFGDLLITGPTDTIRNVGVPAIGDAHDVFGDSGWSVQGLNQKVVLISENCILAWSGSWLAARVAIADLRELSSQAALTADGVRAFLASHPDVAQHGASFLGWVLEQDSGRFAQFRHGAKVNNGSVLGRVALQGSGSSAVEEFVELWGAGKMREKGDTNATVRATFAGFSMAGMLLRAELQGGITAPTLLSMFGGGYEIASFIDGAFRKIGNLTFLIWSAKVTTDGVEISIPQMIIKQDYLGDTLIIRSARLEIKNKTPTLIDEQAHVISPMYDSNTQITEAELLAISYNSPLLCHCIAVENEISGKPSLYTRMQYTSPSSTPAISFNNVGEQFIISMTDDFIKDITNSIKKA